MLECSFKFRVLIVRIWSRSYLQLFLVYLVLLLVSSLFIDLEQIQDYLARPTTNTQPAQLSNEILSYNPEKASPGYNLYSSLEQKKAVLIDMNGQVMHTWHSTSKDKDEGWYQVEPLDNGNVLAITQDRDILKLDQDSNIVWSKPGRFHHDIDIAENGNIFVLSRKDKWVSYENGKIRLLDDLVVVLSPDGEIISEYSLFDIVNKHVPDEVLQKALNYTKTKNPVRLSTDTRADVLHTNSLEILKKDIPGVASKGNVLVCFRTIHLAAILDLEAGQIKWSWGQGQLDHPHHPSITAKDTVLIFDNGRDRLYSQVVEVEPKTTEIVWTFGDQRKGPLFF